MPIQPAHKCACFYLSTGHCAFCGQTGPTKIPRKAPEADRLPPPDSLGKLGHEPVKPQFRFYRPKSTWGKTQIAASVAAVMPEVTDEDVKKILQLLEALNGQDNSAT